MKTALPSKDLYFGVELEVSWEADLGVSFVEGGCARGHQTKGHLFCVPLFWDKRT